MVRRVLRVGGWEWGRGEGEGQGRRSLTSAAPAWLDQRRHLLWLRSLWLHLLWYTCYGSPSQMRNCSYIAFFSRLAILAVDAIGCTVALRVFLRSSTCELPLFSIGQ